MRRKKSQQTEMSFINQNFLKEQRKHREIDERNRITKGLQLLIQHLRNLKPETNTNIPRPRQLNLGLQSKQNQTKQNTTATIRAKYLETKGFYVPDNLKMLSRKQLFSRRKEIIAEIQEAEQNLAAKNKKRPNNKHEIINDLQGLRRQLNLVEFLLFGKKFW